MGWRICGILGFGGNEWALGGLSWAIPFVPRARDVGGPVARTGLTCMNRTGEVIGDAGGWSGRAAGDGGTVEKGDMHFEDRGFGWSSAFNPAFARPPLKRVRVKLVMGGVDRRPSGRLPHHAHQTRLPVDFVRALRSRLARGRLGQLIEQMGLTIEEFNALWWTGWFLSSTLGTSSWVNWAAGDQAICRPPHATSVRRVTLPFSRFERSRLRRNSRCRRRSR